MATSDGRVVARAAWVLPPGAVGRPWLERFDAVSPEIGAALLTKAHEALGGPLPYYAAAPAHWRQRPESKADGLGADRLPPGPLPRGPHVRGQLLIEA
ncbi:hypothetical protein ACFY36_13610 [Actinoplanes sp. NPDC000266]